MCVSVCVCICMRIRVYEYFSRWTLTHRDFSRVCSQYSACTTTSTRSSVGSPETDEGKVNAKSIGSSRGKSRSKGKGDLKQEFHAKLKEREEKGLDLKSFKKKSVGLESINRHRCFVGDCTCVCFCVVFVFVFVFMCLCVYPYVRPYISTCLSLFVCMCVLCMCARACVFARREDQQRYDLMFVPRYDRRRLKWDIALLLLSIVLLVFAFSGQNTHHASVA